MSALVIAAHPDDEVLGCGGTVARLADGGEDVSIAILGEGITSRYTDRSSTDPNLLRALHGRCGEVARLLGCRRPPFLYNLPDNRFDTLPLLDIVKIVESLVAELRPHTIYTHHPGDTNIDHHVTFRAVLAATRPMTGCVVREVYAFEIASSTEWAFGQLAPAFRADTFVDVSATVERKIGAMALYDSEGRPFPHPRSPQALRANATRWGSVAGFEAAEAFELIRRMVP